jgi:hypothetical protein
LEMGSCSLFACVGLNHDPVSLSLPSSYDYRQERATNIYLF